MKKRRKAALLLLLLTTLILTLTTLTYAWMHKKKDSLKINVKGSLVEEYFHSGSGRIDDPFIITRPIHYYHLVEFYQRLTLLPIVYDGNNAQVDFGKDYLYFEIGCPIEKLYDKDAIVEVDENTEYYVFEYTNYGQLKTDENPNGNAVKELNMAYYRDKNSLMPIGTSEVPFVGSLNGNNIVVKNLNIVSKETVLVDDRNGNKVETIRETSDVGIFGYMSSTSSIKNIYFNSVSISLIDAKADVKTDVSKTDIEHLASHADTVYVGYIAGHAHLSSIVDRVYINNMTITGGSASTSNFGYFGFVDDSEHRPITSLEDKISSQFEEGEEPGWGGSMDMYHLYERVDGVRTKARSLSSTYVSMEDIYVDEVLGTTNVVERESSSTGNWVLYESQNGGSYYFYNRTGADQYTYLSGINDSQTKTVTTYTLKDEYLDSYYIMSGSNKLSVDNGAIISTSSLSDKISWHLDNSGYLSTFYQYEKYYLNTLGGSELTLSSTPSTVWLLDNNDRFYTIYNGDNYYISYYSERVGSTKYFTILPETMTINIHSDNNYLSISESSLENTNIENASELFYNSNNKHLYTKINGTYYYLNKGGVVGISPNVSWVYNNGLMYYTYNGVNYYLTLLNNNWVIFPSLNSYIYSNSNYYLSIDNFKLSSTTQEEDAVNLIYNTTTGIISIYLNDEIYYLNKNGVLSTTSDNTSWEYVDNSLSYIYNSTRYYLILYSDSSSSLFFVNNRRNLYTLRYNDNYLGVNNGSIISTNLENAKDLIYDGNTIKFYHNNELYYLNKDLTISSESDNTNYIYDNSNLYYTYNNLNYYLRYHNNNFSLFPSKTSYTFSITSNYLTINNSVLSNTTNISDATHFVYDGISSVIYTYDGENILYLNRDGILSTTSDNTIWEYESNTLSYLYDSKRYYLVYSLNRWMVIELVDSYIISDSSMNYLGVDNNRLTLKNNISDASMFIFNGTNGIVSLKIGSNTYYLNRDGILSTNSDNTVWFYNGNRFYYVYNGEYYYLYSNGLNFVVLKDLNEYKFYTSNNYLSVNNNLEIINQNEANSTSFYVEDDYIFTVISGIKYYLNGKDEYLELNVNRETIFNYSSNTLSYSYNGDTYEVFYNDGWASYNKNVTYYRISDERGHNLNVDSSNNLISSSTQGEIFRYNNDSKLYVIKNKERLYLSTEASLNALVTLSKTIPSGTWSYGINNYLSYKTSSTDYYLLYNNGSWMVNSNTIYFRVSSDTNYMNTNGTTGVARGTDINEATLYNFSNTSNPSGVISTGINGTTYYIYASTSSINLSTTNSTNFNYSNRRLYFSSGWSSYYIRYRNNNFTITRSTGTQLTFGDINPIINYSSISYTSTINRTINSITPYISLNLVDVNQYINMDLLNENVVIDLNELSPINYSFSYKDTTTSLTFINKDNDILLTNTLLQVEEKVVEYNVKSGHPTFIPLSLKSTSDTDLYSYTDDYEVDSSNTGYLISGAYDTTRYKSDIRVSRYSMSDISTALNQSTYDDSKLQVLTVTKNSNGLVRIMDAYNEANINNYNSSLVSRYMSVADLGLERYGDNSELKLSRQKLSEMMTSSGTNLYGLHFMNSSININNLVTAEKVVILGSTYYNYELPEDCIDFRVQDKGYITFFAGTYFPGNNSFFSLNHIYRDQNQKITDIKEISLIYEPINPTVLSNYIYKYSDGTYSNADGTYSGSLTLDETYNSNPIFNTDWIMYPTLIEDAVYYFEIPCNKGEYALGSTQGMTGAYLFYLDIGSRGGSKVETLISNEGNEITETFKVDFRDPYETTQYSLMQFQISLPNDDAGSNISITTSFSRENLPINGDYEGLYIINIVNKTNSNLKITVYLVDDDDNIYNDYPYAYKIIYTNNNMTNEILMNGEFEYFKKVSSYIIPSYGSAQ